MIQVAHTNIQPKIIMNGLLFDSLTLIQGFCQSCPRLMLLTIFIDTETRNKCIQITDYEIKIVNFADSTIIFLRDFSCLTKKQLILELCEKATSSKITFQKAGPYAL